MMRIALFFCPLSALDAQEFHAGRVAQCRSMCNTPLFEFIEPKNFIPSSLHVIMGEFQAIYDQDLKPMAERHGLTAELDAAVFGTLCAVVDRTKSRNGSLMHDLGLLVQLSNMQSFSKASMLNDKEIREIRRSAGIYHSIATGHFPALCRSPKFHWFVNHVGDFAERHRFFGLLSEQGIEHFHSICRRDMERFKRSNDPAEKLF